MDGQRFDDLTRSLARGVSRRTLMKGLTGGVSGGLAVLLGRGAVDAGQASCGNVVCAGLGDICAAGCECCVFGNGNSRCMTGKQCLQLRGTIEAGGCPAGTTSCQGACLSPGQCCTAADCPAPSDPCQGTPACTADHACVATPLGNDTACGSGGICCNGACIAACTATDQCHGAGNCDPTTGQCTSPALNGVPCDDGNVCTQGDTCQQGQCVGGPAVVCTAQDQCHDAGECDPTTGLCSNPMKSDGEPCDTGNLCTWNNTCQQGVCTGQPVNCDDGLSCTTDTCDPAHGCLRTLQPGFCLIDHVCYTDQSLNPANACQRCDVATATDAWSPAPQGTTCAASTCTDGTQTDFACDGAGTCDSTSHDCGLYHCTGAGVCHTTCADDTDCLGAAYCDDSTQTCKGDQGNGAPCTSADQCQSGFCVDGVCCSTSCTDQCAACNVTGQEGTCAPVTGQPVGDRPACANTGADPACFASCNGTTTTSCTYPGAETACGEGPRCADGGLPVAIGQDVCSGDGACNIGALTTCTPFACVNGSCATSCTDVTQCVPTAACTDGVCIGQNLPNGSPCTSDYECASGLCPLGVCCIISTDPTDCEDCFHQCTGEQVCRDHQCVTVTTCDVDADCPSGRCCNSVCVSAVDNCTACGVACAAPSAPCEAVSCQDHTCVTAPKPAGAFCRAGTGDCELTAVCDGIATDCPPNPIFVGAPCGIGNPCFEPGTGNCQPDGSCAGTPSVTCTDDDGLACTTSVCDPTTGACVQQIDQDFCLITLDSTGQPACIPAGAPWDDGPTYLPCAVCDPSQSQTSWTVLPNGTDCSDADHCQADATCQSGVCRGTPIVTCQQPTALCQEAVCDPRTGGCVVQPVATGGFDQKGCDVCANCANGTCRSLSTVDCGLCMFCNPDTGACEQAPEGTDCGSNCTQTLLCDATGQCQAHDTGGCLVNIDPCADVVCDQTSGQCVETGSKNGQTCGPDRCHVCDAGRCVPKTCATCEQCDLGTGTCQSCTQCCDGICGGVECNGACCGADQVCGRHGILNQQICCATDFSCGGVCYPRAVDCCAGPPEHVCLDSVCCADQCCPTGATCCGFQSAVRCCGAGETCCAAALGGAGCCASGYRCTSIGCVP